MYEVASPDRVRDSLTRFLWVQLRPELSERATSTRLPSLWIHIWDENNFKFWADSRQLQKMLRGRFWHYLRITIHDIEMLRGSWLLSPVSPWPDLAWADPGVRARSAESQSLLGVILGQAEPCQSDPGPGLHRSCELWTVTGFREPWVFFTGKQQSILAVITLIHNNVKCSWKLYQYGRSALLLWHQNKVKKGYLDVNLKTRGCCDLVTCQSWRFACNSISLSSRCQNPRIIIQNLAFFS